MSCILLCAGIVGEGILFDMGSLPAPTRREQNPHMHLCEALLAWYEATGNAGGRVACGIITARKRIAIMSSNISIMAFAFPKENDQEIAARVVLTEANGSFWMQ